MYTGKLTTATEPLNRESTPSLTLTVFALDGGDPVKRSESVLVTVVLVDINDEDPVLNQTQTNFIIKTNHRVGAMVTATDADLSPEIAYQLENITSFPSSFGLGSTPLFSIRDSSSGMITLERELSEVGTFCLQCLCLQS